MNRPRELHALVSPGKVCEEAAGITQDKGDVPIRESKMTRDVPVVQHGFGLNATTRIYLPERRYKIWLFCQGLVV